MHDDEQSFSRNFVQSRNFVHAFDARMHDAFEGLNFKQMTILTFKRLDVLKILCKIIEIFTRCAGRSTRREAGCKASLISREETREEMRFCIFSPLHFFPLVPLSKCFVVLFVVGCKRGVGVC